MWFSLSFRLKSRRQSLVSRQLGLRATQDQDLLVEEVVEVEAINREAATSHVCHNTLLTCWCAVGLEVYCFFCGVPVELHPSVRLGVHNCGARGVLFFLWGPC